MNPLLWRDTVSKVYLAKPIVVVEKYENIADVLPLLDASTHKVKVEENNEIIGHLKLKEDCVLVDGKITNIKYGRVKKNKLGWSKKLIKAFDSYPDDKTRSDGKSKLIFLVGLVICMCFFGLVWHSCASLFIFAIALPLWIQCIPVKLLPGLK